MLYIFIMIIYYIYVFNLLWERESKWVKDRERGRERIPSRLRSISTKHDAEGEHTVHEIMNWAEMKSDT